MKSAFELAMERFGGSIRQFTDEQKAALAEVDSLYESQIVQARFDARSRLENAADADEEKRRPEELAVEIRSREERRDRKKEELRSSFG